MASLNDIRAQLVSRFERSGLSQQELSRASGVHFVTVNRFLRNKQDPTFEICEKLARALGLEIQLRTIRQKVG